MYLLKEVEENSVNTLQKEREKEIKSEREREREGECERENGEGFLKNVFNLR